jgi:hypothetical protein
MNPNLTQIFIYIMLQLSLLETETDFFDILCRLLGEAAFITLAFRDDKLRRLLMSSYLLADVR